MSGEDQVKRLWDLAGGFAGTVIQIHQEDAQEITRIIQDLRQRIAVLERQTADLSQARRDVALAKQERVASENRANHAEERAKASYQDRLRAEVLLAQAENELPLNPDNPGLLDEIEKYLGRRDPMRKLG